MDAGHLDVLQNAADVHVLAVAQGVQVAFHGAFQELVQVYRVVRGDGRRLGHVAGEPLIIVDDAHAPASEHVAGAHEQRVADLAGGGAGLIEPCGHGRARVGDVEGIEQRGEPVAVLGQIDGVRARAHDGHPGPFQSAGQLQRRLTAEGDHDAVGISRVDDVHDVLVGERLEK